MSSLTVRDYHIGWICALEDEFTAAMAMLDEEHPMIAGQDKQDHNSYVLGKIHQHHVVIACMPAGVDGLVPAVTVAKDMARTFPELRVGLMVGIGGGIPNLPLGVDIRLGDVVVSMPDKAWGGVVQYDHGKAESGGVFTVKGQLNQPPEFLLRTLSQVQARHRMRPSKITEYIAEAVTRNSMLEENGFVRPEAPDQLVCPVCCTFVDDVSSRCNGWHQRKRRKHLSPVIHHGIIASGNVVVKDAVVRDRLRDQFGALCVEMEAAGLMNDFPCLVVRGICDYADCYKNDGWHGYAAMTAAAYAKEFLFYVSPAQASQEKPIRETVREIVDFLRDLRQDSRAQTHALQAQTNYWQDDKHQRCHQAFKPIGSYEEQKDRNPGRVEGTCQWVLTHEQYQWWHDNRSNSLLWISADPGCGKSVLAKSLVDHELQGSSRHSICYFFFKDNEDQDNVATALCALLHQLLVQQPQLIRHALAIYDPNKPEKVQQDVAQLWQTLLAAAGDVDAWDVTCVLDALDECRPQDRRKAINMMAQFHKQAQRQPSTNACLKFLVTSRPYDDIQDDFERMLRDLPTIRLRGEEENEQIHTEIDIVIKIRVAELSSNLRLSKVVRHQLQDKLLCMKHRTYLWLHLAMDSIKEALKNSRRPQLESVEQLPSSVEDAYEKILGQISGIKRAMARDILRIVVGSRRPLTVLEMAIAFGVADRRARGVNSLEDSRLDAQWVEASLRRWCGLFIFFHHKRIYLIHQTAKEFLLAGSRVCDIPSGWKHCLDAGETEMQMARICTDLLSFKDTKPTTKDIVRRCKRWGPIEGVLNQDSEIETLVAYAAENWPSHFRAAQSVVDERYVEELTSFYYAAGGLQHLWFPIYWRATEQYEDKPHVDALQLAALLGHAQQVARMLQPARLYRPDEVDKVGNTALIWTSRYGHTQIVQMLLGAGVDVNAQGGRNGTALQAASATGHKQVVQILLEAGADMNIQRGWHETALQAASARGHKQVVQILLDKGANVNAQGGIYGTALQAASRNGHEQVVQVLLEAGADGNKKGGLDDSALQAASARGYKQVVQMLLNKGADVNAQGGHNGNALQVASEEGHEQVVQVLLEAGADVDAQGGRYGTALRAASKGGYEQVVRILLKAGADIDAHRGGHGTALQTASATGHKQVVQILLEAGADMNIQRGWHETALQTASARGYKQVVQMLLNKGADVNAQEGEYGNALQAASEGGHEQVVQVLLEAGADVNAQGGPDGTALRAASARGYKQIVQILLKAGVDVNAQEGGHGTALRAASKGGYEQVVRILLEAGADMNIQRGWHETALQAASARGHKQVVQILLDKGANVNAQGGIYGTALQAASRNGHEQVVQVLLEAGADGSIKGGPGRQRATSGIS